MKGYNGFQFSSQFSTFSGEQRMHKLPPESLIRTWVWMMSEKDNPELMQKGRQNLINAFGSLQKAIEHIEKQVNLDEAN